jgi:lipid A ethanolaminephosphotransferase
MLVFMVSLWIALTCNAGYWRVLAANAPLGELPSIAFLAEFLALTVGLTALVLLILAIGWLARAVLALALIVAAAAGYFAASLGVIFDTEMLVNVLETNPAEALELITRPMVAFIVAFGLLPGILVLRAPIEKRGFPRMLAHKGLAVTVALSLIAGPLFVDQKEIFSVARNHQELRYLIAPLNVVAASYRVARDSLQGPTHFTKIATDATHVSASNIGARPTVHVLIVGETARAANFSLNGYVGNTNPSMQKLTGVQFLKVTSCGTATAVSLPCMFSLQEHSNFDREESRQQENLLDIAARAGYEVFWVDNGNGCKGICSRISSRDVHSSNIEGICPDGECFDEILVHELDAILSSVSGDSLIVLHQLGSHGPAYYRRYPDEYRVFRPDCRSANLGDCNSLEIMNAYDNTIVYTDHVIAAAIDALKKRSNEINASLLYISDHGESLGEHNLFLHGMPYAFAPDEQTKVPLIAWISEGFQDRHSIQSPCKLKRQSTPVSHDNLFHSELGLLGIQTAEYEPEKDLFSTCRNSDQTSALRRASAGELPT